MGNINQKSFNLYKRVSKSFTLAIYGFFTSTTFIFRCSIPFAMQTVMRIAQKISVPIKFGKIRMTISTISLRQKLANTIKIPTCNMSFVIKTSEKWFASLIGTGGAFRIPLTITANSSARERWFSDVISLGKIKLGRSVCTFIPILANYKHLNTTDTQTLNDLDILTLGDLDYVVT